MIISKKQIPADRLKLTIDGKIIEAPLYVFDTVVVGSGAAGLNTADLLASGTNDSPCSVAIVTEGLKMGTSRNTGSDKQTYYKLTLSGSTPDSVEDMAESLFSGGAMDGDLALCEAAGSARGFLRLVELGVPFPYNDFGEFAGYQTDHDTRTRATSCGPLTSKYMTEALEASVMSKDIPIFDGYRVFKLLKNGDSVCGLAAICPESSENPFGLVIFRARNVVFATGGPSAIYRATVYPESQTCSHGLLLEAGVSAQNVTESQYGLASVDFRWNLSGTYQQVLPRYFSTDQNGGDEREFLNDSFAFPEKQLTAQFKKGYQWPFDPKKLDSAIGNDSSLVDIAVFKEKLRGRRVFMDFRRNPSFADTNGRLYFELLEKEPFEYLEKSGALLPTPIERLQKMNAPAIELYRSHGIDLYSEPLEIDMCAQHNNGGFAVDTNYESISVKNLYIVGEAAGVFGIHRPGGSALNSTQVGSQRAADVIRRTKQNPTELPLKIEFPELHGCMNKDGNLSFSEIMALRTRYSSKMSECGAFIRNPSEIKKALADIKTEIAEFNKYSVDSPRLLIELLINRDILITQLVYLSAILEYIENGGKSRGSYLICDKLPESGVAVEIDSEHFAKVCEVRLTDLYKNKIEYNRRDVRPIPSRDNWFENIYNAYRQKYSL